jgi:hypothetical protein
MTPNPRGPRDETIHVIRLGTDAVIWNYACHPVFVPWMSHVSADFAGVVRQAIRRQFGDSVAVLYWQGFSGDVFPSFASELVGLSARLQRRFFGKPTNIGFDTYHTWTKSLVQCVLSALGTVSMMDVPGLMYSKRTSRPLRLLLANEKSGKDFRTHEIHIGSGPAGIHVLGVSAEPAVGYIALFQELIKDPSLICVGCMDAAYGYLPTSQMIQEGGYEAREFLPYFSLEGAFAPGIEQAVRKLVA